MFERGKQKKADVSHVATSVFCVAFKTFFCF